MDGPNTWPLTQRLSDHCHVHDVISTVPKGQPNEDEQFTLEFPGRTGACSPVLAVLSLNILSSFQSGAKRWHREAYGGMRQIHPLKLAGERRLHIVSLGLSEIVIRVVRCPERHQQKCKSVD